jgi:hypothetical protein
LRLVEQPVARNVGPHLGHDVVDRCGDGGPVGVFGNGAENGVAHDDRRFGRIEDDDRLAPCGAADGLRRAAGGLGEPSMFARVPRPADTDETDATISAIATRTTRENARGISMPALINSMIAPRAELYVPVSSNAALTSAWRLTA